MKFLKLLLLPFAFAVVGIIRVLARCGVLIRFGELWSNRIGHLAGNTECYLCERDAGMHKAIDIWTHTGTPANEYLAEMYARCLLIDHLDITRLVRLCNMMFTGWEKH